MTLKTPNGRANHIHEPGLVPGQATESCPWCHQPISRAEYDSIRERIATEERARIAEVEKGLQEKFAREKAQAEAQAKAATAKAQAATKGAVVKAKQEAVR